MKGIRPRNPVQLKEKTGVGNRKRIDLKVIQTVKYPFSIAVVTNYHRFSGLNNTNLSLQFCRLEI